MIKVLLVDDEIIVRKGLKALFDWKKYDMTVVEEASNGEKALEILNAQPIDLVVTDIRMPIIDGIELTRLIKENFPQTKVVLLTCYNDFEYVKEALEIGAVGYLLKTDIEDGKLEHMIEKVKTELIQLKNKEKVYQELQWHAEQSLPLLREKWIQSLLKGDASSDLKQNSKELGLDWIYAPHLIMLLDLKHSTSNSLEWCTELFNKSHHNDQSIFIRSGTSSSFLAIIKQPFEASDQKKMLWESQITSKVFYDFKEVCDKTNLYYGNSFSPDQLSEKCRNLEKIREYHTFYDGLGSIVNTDQFIIPKEVNIFNLLDFTKLKQSVIVRNWCVVKKILSEIFRTIAQRKIAVESAKLITTEIIKVIIDGLHSNIHIINSVWGNNMFEFIDKVKEKHTLSQLYDWLNQGIENLEEVRFMFMGLSNKEILKAKQFIELNYQNDISLDVLCAYVGLSKSYLSSTFKKVTGENIIDYVIKLRIEKAKQLLRETDLKVFEVAETVGFRDPKYFSKLFKCIEGTSPGKFKEFVGT